MPFLQTSRFDTGETITFVNVEHAVGHAAPNTREDVKLVQYLLNALDYELKVDGWYGQKTRQAILQYQNRMRMSGYRTAPDGRVDRARGESVFGSISGSVYTIVSLCQDCFYHNPSAWFRLGQFIYIKPAESVGPAGNDYIPSAGPQSTSPGGPARAISSFR